ncbi:24047_t:CDS:2, partial [Gigaspora margarita]
DILQVSDDDAITITATMSNSNIVSDIPITSVTSIISNKKKVKPRSPVSPYFLQKTIDNKIHPGWNTTKSPSSQQLLTFAPKITISSQILTPVQKTKLHMLVAEWIVSDTLP